MMQLKVANADLPGAWAQRPRSFVGVIACVLGISLEDLRFL